MSADSSPSGIFKLSTTFSLVETIRTSDGSSIRSVALCKDGRYIAIGYNSGRIEVYTTAPYKPHRMVSVGNMAGVLALAWHPLRPRYLVAGGANGNIHIFKFGQNPSDDIYDRISFSGYISNVVWHPDGRQLAVIAAPSLVIIDNPLSVERLVHHIDMNTLIVPSLVISVSSTPLELHYLDEYSLFVVFMNEIIVLPTTFPFRPTWAIDPVKGAFFGRISISPDRKQIVATNLSDGVDRYLVSDANWITTHSMYDIVGRERASRLYGLTYLDSKTIVCGNNGSNIVVVHDTERLGRNRYIFRTFQLGTIDRVTRNVIAGFVKNVPVIIATNGENAASRLCVIALKNPDRAQENPRARSNSLSEEPSSEIPEGESDEQNARRPSSPRRSSLCDFCSIWYFLVLTINLTILAVAWAIIVEDRKGLPQRM